MIAYLYIVLLIISFNPNVFAFQDEATSTAEMREPFEGRSLSVPIPSETNQEIQRIRDQNVINWIKSLIRSQSWWYFTGNIAELMSQLCYVASPVLSGCAAALKYPNLALSASIVGSCGIGFGKFGKFAHKESSERGEAANKLLEKEGVRPINSVPSEISSSPT